MAALTAIHLQDQVREVDTIPPDFDPLSSIDIGTYKRDGGGANITSQYLARVFLLAVVMYVDNMDLLHWAESPLRLRMRS